VKEYNDLLSYNHIFIKRTANVGVISAEDALAWGLSGPVIRGSGIKWDLRKVQPNCAYDEFEFDVPIGDGRMGQLGDCWDRYMVRMREIEQSVRILRQVLPKLAATPGDVLHKSGKTLKLPADEVYMETEAPRGQLGFFVAGDGSQIPSRVKARGPCFC